MIHRCGILKEKIVYDLGASVYTRNLAWDKMTGKVILTETVNEFNDNYYMFNYPSYWLNKGMGMASENIDLTGRLVKIGPLIFIG
ncbi:hypothetical protein [Flavobacterium sp. 3HN19-14]|uniref:hypothetical protein n=1 Tax=Flavobacterium sp. 3HN19-14 TaxID=3448133 RepID=UPI003EE3CDD7